MYEIMKVGGTSAARTIIIKRKKGTTHGGAVFAFVVSCFLLSFFADKNPEFELRYKSTLIDRCFSKPLRYDVIVLNMALICLNRRPKVTTKGMIDHARTVVRALFFLCERWEKI